MLIANVLASESKLPRFTALDQPGLEKTTRERYAAVKQEYDQFLRKCPTEAEA
jgi:hypothetical protein